jgi:hypothetical protein
MLWRTALRPHTSAEPPDLVAGAAAYDRERGSYRMIADGPDCGSETALESLQ